MAPVALWCLLAASREVNVCPSGERKREQEEEVEVPREVPGVALAPPLEVAPKRFLASAPLVKRLEGLLVPRQTCCQPSGTPQSLWMHIPAGRWGSGHCTALALNIEERLGHHNFPFQLDRLILFDLHFHINIISLSCHFHSSLVVCFELQPGGGRLTY